jgi:hypothetical protein
MINPRSIASIGIGFGAYAEATIGFITQQAYNITSYWGGAGNYREYKRKKPSVRIVKKLVEEVANDIVPKYMPIKAYTRSIDIMEITRLIQLENKQIAKQFVKNYIERKVREEQDEEDFLLLCCF